MSFEEIVNANWTQAELGAARAVQVLAYARDNASDDYDLRTYIDRANELFS